MTTPFAQRRRALRKQLDEAELGALIVTQPASWYYLTGFTGEAGALILSAQGTTLITDSRFTEQARREAPGVRVAQQSYKKFRNGAGLLGFMSGYAVATIIDIAMASTSDPSTKNKRTIGFGFSF